MAADRLGYSNILLPSSWQVGQDPLVFASGIAPQIRNMSLLVAIRSGEVFPPMLARAVASLDHMLEGRLTLNVISSDLPGTRLDSESRYRRSGEAIEILQQVWSQDHVHFDGEFWQLRRYDRSGADLAAERRSALVFRRLLGAGPCAVRETL